ncbi:MAG: bifunctional UDP-N-acetylmuramoyl-tripeptide:D-alanyl-D-alanine ligase/alanine racemase [Chitinophagaceae bacterium]|nr:bifunctional UDP-N-acetylmuramoyl-tripeptide:D-alanyl-D-alanine ligase/alanine racemase [Chitinophagaceae bacterium]MCA6486975.1 bifunctional UDP-N-acetylmuramoyl-tripeptide:D-alanyl-D-alanine ligase/alanine racemase [Chitinophagaceae bacterium]
MQYTLQHIATILGVDIATDVDFPIRFLLTDSRRLVVPAETLFFALPGDRRDGHDYLEELKARGVKAAVIRSDYPDISTVDFVCLRVATVLSALQQLAAHHRRQFTIPVIGITGSNGKTIVKEWLYQLIGQDETIVRSPKSYNSQVGVPLSVWLMNEQHTLGIFEAGISTRNEMQQLANVIQPTIGIFTNLSDAHSEGFHDRSEKGAEKMLLFKGVQQIIFAADEIGDAFPEIGPSIGTSNSVERLFWSRKRASTLQIMEETKSGGQTVVKAIFQQREFILIIPFTDTPSVNNAFTCWLTMVALGYDAEEASRRLLKLEPIDMRMQLKKAVNQCTLINDSYSNDETSLALAIDYQMQQAGGQKTILILSDLLTAELSDEELYPRLASMMKSKGISHLIGVGPRISSYAPVFEQALPQTNFFPDKDGFLQHFLLSDFQSSVILIKGARVFRLEKIAHWLEIVTHQTQLTIHLGALSRNIRRHQALLHADTKLMVVLKAFGYGSGSTEIARMLQYQQVNYIAVAYIDEGIELRKSGVRLPIMVMNAEESGWEAMLQHQLEPELYSAPMTERFIHLMKREGLTSYPVHIKINTGMNRLGYDPDELPVLCDMICNQEVIRVQSVFSHFVASEDPGADDYTKSQLALFLHCCATIRAATGYDFLRHIANSSAIQRIPEAQLDMVRLGMGMYGGDASNQLQLEPVAILTSTIAQIRKVSAGKTIGYGRTAEVSRDTMVAVINIGYADGFSRQLGNGVGEVWVAGHRAKVLGHVCMDMTMIDVTDIPDVVAGMEVEIFGRHLPISLVARNSGTISYDIMTGISARVKRVYVEE